MPFPNRRCPCPPTPPPSAGRRPDERFLDGRYSRAHEWAFDGGARVPASSSPHVARPPFSDPAGVDPEEALVASLASRHMLFVLDFAGRTRAVLVV